MQSPRIFAALAVFSLGCSAPPETRPSVPSIAPSLHPDILGGAVDTTHASVVVITQTYTNGNTSLCTGTLVAPTLVLTARHCVAYYDGGEEACALPGHDADGFQLPTYTGDAAPSAFSITRVPGGPVLGRGTRIFDDGARTSCGHDLAVLQIDTPVHDLPIAPVRRTLPSVGEKVTAVGWGYVDDQNTSATSRMDKSTSVRAIGPTIATYHPYDDATQPAQNVSVMDGEIAVDVGTTAPGDSGGPSFDAQGNVVSVVSRGFSPASSGPDTFTTAAAHLATLDQAFAAVGFVADAGSGSDDHEAGAEAPRGDAGPPPPPQAVDAGRHRADAAPAAAPPDDVVVETGSGCSVARSRGASSWLGALAALLVWARSRRGAARRSS